MKKYILLTLLVTSLFTAHAQQDPLYSQYVNNPLVLNPAMAGLSDNLSANVSYRQQWGGLPGSPKTFNANAAMSILNNTAGAGIMLLSDKIGSTTTTEFYAMGSYRIQLSRKQTLAFGLQAGMINYKINNDQVNPYDTSDPYFQGTISQMKPSIGAGLMLKTDNLEVGLSVPRMLKSSSNIDGNQFALYSQHFYAYAAYRIHLSDRLALKPAVLLKAVQAAPLSTDINAALIIDNKFQVGALTRNFNNYGLFGRAQLGEALVFGFVYEVPTSKSVGTNYSTFELTLGLRLKALPYHASH